MRPPPLSAGAAGHRATALAAKPPPSPSDDPLDRLLGHVCALVPAGAAMLMVQGERLEVRASRFASTELSVELEPLIRSLARQDLSETRCEELPHGSLITCPVMTASGQALGVVVVASLDPKRPLSSSDVSTVEVLAGLAALALERSELLRSETARAREELLLAQAAERISASLELQDVYGRIVDHAVRICGGDRALLTRLEHGTRQLVPVARKGGWLTGQLPRPTQGSMLSEVVRSRRAYLSDPADRERWDPRVMRIEGIESFIHAPIELGPRLFGVLTVASAAPDSFDERDLERLVKLSRLAAAAIANGFDFERERRVARALTRGFVPRALPELPGWELDVLYEPAGHEATGGDLYGAWPLPGNRLAVLVGDVAGKGLETAAFSAMARFFIEARSWDCDLPSEVLAQASAMLNTRLPQDSFVTAFLGLLSVDRLVYCSAGHPAPLVLRAGRDPDTLGQPALPLGIRTESAYDDQEVDFRAGDLLIAYTDGIAEARRGDHQFGLDRLVDAADSAHGLPLGELLRHVFAQAQSFAGRLDDDAVLLAVRRSD